MRGLHKIYSTLLSFDSADVAEKNNVAALSLLLNIQTNRAHQMAREVYQKNPSNDVFASTYAYSLQLQGRTAEALKIAGSISEKHLESPSLAVYYALLLVAAEQPDKAKKYLSIAETGKLLPEERAMLVAAKAAL